MAKQRTTEDKIRVKVIPMTDIAHKEGFAKVNGKVIPYDVPVIISRNDLIALERMKEPKRNNGAIDVHKIMEDLKVPQEQANRIARESEREGVSKGVKFVKKYTVIKLS